MTDAELATLKPGDRVLLHGEQHVVSAVDRRRVFLHGETDVMKGRAYDAGDLIVLPPLVAQTQEMSEVAISSLESRWRALTDEVLVALKRLVGDGVSLDDLMIRVAADEDRASAEIHRLITEPGEPPRAIRVATCAVGVDITGEKPS